MSANSTLTVDELADQTGVPVRTVRYYISEGLLPGASGRGKAASYTRGHVDRLRLIRRLTERRVPLAEQRERLSQLSSAQVQALLAQEEKQAEELRVAETETPADFIGALLRHAQAARGRPSEAMSPSRSAPLPSRRGTTRGWQVPASGESWQRIQLVPGLELHVRSDMAGLHSWLIERLLKVARRGPRS